MFGLFRRRNSPASDQTPQTPPIPDTGSGRLSDDERERQFEEAGHVAREYHRPTWREADRIVAAVEDGAWKDMKKAETSHVANAEKLTETLLPEVEREEMKEKIDVSLAQNDLEQEARRGAGSRR